MSRKVLRRRVKVILDEWDPIGVDADNEYDSYISGIVRLLESGASAYKIKKHLENLATVSMGLSRKSRKTQEAVQRLVELVESDI